MAARCSLIPTLLGALLVLVQLSPALILRSSAQSINVTVWQPLGDPSFFLFDDRTSSLWVVDASTHCVWQLSQSGEPLTSRPLAVNSLAIDSQGAVVISPRDQQDYFSHTFSKVNWTTGAVVWTVSVVWEVYAVCVDGADNMYVVGAYPNNQGSALVVMEKRSSDGSTVLLSFNATVQSTGFSCWVDAADGSVYTGLSKYDATGQLDSTFAVPTGLVYASYETIGRGGDVYIDNSFYQQVARIDAQTGALKQTYQWGADVYDYTGASAHGVAVDADGSVYAFNYDRGVITKLAANGSVLHDLTMAAPGVAAPSPNFLTIDSNGSLYAHGLFVGLTKFDSTGITLFTFPTLPLIGAPVGAAVDYQGNVWMSSGTGSRIIQQVDCTGAALVQVALSTGPQPLPGALCMGGSRDLLWVIDQNNIQMQAFNTTTGASLTLLTLPADSTYGGDLIPLQCATDSLGNLYVTQANSLRQVVRLNSSGEPTLRISGGPSSLTPMYNPSGIAVTPSGSNIFVASGYGPQGLGPPQILQFDQCGRLIRLLSGAIDSQVNISSAYYVPLTLDSQGNLYAVDGGNGRILVFQNAVVDTSAVQCFPASSSSSTASSPPPSTQSTSTPTSHPTATHSSSTATSATFTTFAPSSASAVTAVDHTETSSSITMKASSESTGVGKGGGTGTQRNGGSSSGTSSVIAVALLCLWLSVQCSSCHRW